MQIVVVGLSQHTAPLSIRERFAFAPAALPDALAALRGVTSGAFILSTCNRVEVYAVAGHAESGRRALTRFLVEYHGATPGELERVAYAYGHDEAVRHLFRVAGGLDSMVLGEDQILAQLKGALTEARAVGALGSVLHRAGTAALAVGKRVRSETAISRAPLSVVSVALLACGRARGDLAALDVLIVGAGEMAELALRHLDGGRARRVTLVGRSAERTAALGARYGAAVRAWGELAAALAEADVVLTCTSAPAPVVRAADVGADRRARPLLVLDLGVPRDVEPEIDAIAGVTRHDLDHLQAITDESRLARAAQVGDAERIVDDGVERFMEWWRSRSVAPAIEQLWTRAAAIRDAEVEQALARLPELSERGHFVVRGLAERIVSKLLHDPVTALRTDPEGANMAQVLCQLFQLDATTVDAHCPIVSTDGAAPGAAARSPARVAPDEDARRVAPNDEPVIPR